MKKQYHMWHNNLFARGLFCLTVVAWIMPTASLSMPNNEQSIQIQSLKAPDTKSIGFETDLPVILWQDVASIQKLTTDILNRPITPAIYHILTELMSAQTIQNGLPLDYRVHTLIQLGNSSAALNLLNLLPSTYLSQSLAEYKATALFLSGQTKEACSLGKTMPSLQKWSDQMRFACAVAQKDKAAAELIFATGSEQNEWDRTTKILGEKLLNIHNHSLKEDIVLDIRHIHLAGALGEKFPWDKASVSRTYYGLLATIPTIPNDWRIIFAEKSPSTTNLLPQLYQSASDKTTSKRAKIYKKIQTENNPTEKIHLIHDFLYSASQDKLFPVLAPMMSPIITTITPNKTMSAYGFYVVQALALTNNIEHMNSWIDVLSSSNSPNNNQAALLSPLYYYLEGKTAIPTQTAMQSCLQKTTPECHRFFHMTQDIPTHNLYAFFAQDKTTSAFVPPITQDILTYLAKTNRLGEAFLYAIYIHQNSTQFEPVLMTFLHQTQPKRLSHTLTIEHFLYQ